MLRSFEARHIAAAHPLDGRVPQRFRALCTVALFLVLLAMAAPRLPELNIVSIVYITLLAALLARTMAIDLSHFLLLDIYTFPILLLGLLSPFTFTNHGDWYDPFAGGALGLCFGFSVSFVVAKLKGDTITEHIGGGDIKMLAALGVWAGLGGFFPALTLAAFFGFGLAAFAQKDGNTPYGPALGLAIWLMALYPDGVQLLFLRLYQSIW
ncbi:MAG: hypothetical protein GC134_08875 [Proteobacteria bacterium]|nr:hypothetical protein [Pseudomonadota bacterium]